MFSQKNCFKVSHFCFSDKHQVIFQGNIKSFFCFTHSPCVYQILLVFQSLDNIKSFFIFQSFFMIEFRQH
jgi:hypothetical protein